MKILIISKFFYPSVTPRSFRTTALAKAFAKAGHEVQVYTSWNEEIHPAYAVEHGMEIHPLSKWIWKDIRADKGAGPFRLVRRILKRGLQLSLEYPDIQFLFTTRRLLRKKNGYDLLITIAVPHAIHWGAALARTRKHRIAKTWVADCGDPFMFEKTDTFRKWFYFAWFEKLFCRKADHITVPIEDAKEAYYPEFRHKIKMIPQGYDFNEVPIDHNLYRKNPVPTFAYAGAFIPGVRDPKNFLEYLLTLKCPFLFIIYTNQTSIVIPYAERSEGRIEIRPYVPRAELLPVLAGMDFLVNIGNGTNIQSPSKLIDYQICGRPVLSVDSFSLNSSVITQFLSGDYSGQISLGDLSAYDIKNVSKQFLQLTQ
ncbi:MAG: glycosyltransferase [Chitinophagales bacterium]|nr:glycosyltransferase [Chitinophagales bacterium]MCB9021327.1 glycosyltransferase [Chitinophagales bacterium]